MVYGASYVAPRPLIPSMQPLELSLLHKEPTVPAELPAPSLTTAALYKTDARCAQAAAGGLQARPLSVVAVRRLSSRTTAKARRRPSLCDALVCERE